MFPKRLKELLEEVKSGGKTVSEALEILRFLPYEDLSCARIDHHRSLRTGIPEAIFCEGKDREQIRSIAENIVKRGGDLIATRADKDIFDELKGIDERLTYHSQARMITLQQTQNRAKKGLVLIVTGGTADIPVAEEARITCDILCSRTETLYDVGVAGIHRLLMEEKRLFEARVICVAAGMEGALASIVGGMTDRPIIAIPTSVGYGANFGGISALLTMINSCAPGVCVVNIDNGFGAGCMAHKINMIGEVE